MALMLDPARYRELFDRVQDILYVRDMNGVLLYINESGARFLGRPREALLGTTLHQHDDDHQAQSLQATNEILLRDGIDRSTVEIRGRVLEATTTLIRDEQGNPTGAYGVMRDITESVNLQASLERRMREAQEAREQLRADHERKTRELEEARALHLSMLPRSLPALAHGDIAVYSSTATEVGGDYYDWVTDERGVATIAIGDATGHGMRAGVLVATAKSYFQTLACDRTPRETLLAISQALRNLGSPALYMCMMLARIEAHAVSIVSAGMPPILVRSPRGVVDRVAIAGMPLGLRARPQFDEHTVAWERGTAILFVSDGLTEVPDAAGRELGYQPIERAFAQDGSAQETLDRVIAAAGDRTPSDDITAIVLKSV